MSHFSFFSRFSSLFHFFSRFSSLFFVFLRFSSFFCLFSWKKGKRLQFTGKMGNFTPTPSAPTPFGTSRRFIAQHMSLDHRLRGMSRQPAILPVEMALMPTGRVQQSSKRDTARVDLLLNHPQVPQGLQLFRDMERFSVPSLEG